MIRAVLDQLTQTERRLLNYAFEHQLGQYVELPHGRYIGVHLEGMRHLEPQEQAGAWSYGIVKGKGEN